MVLIFTRGILQYLMALIVTAMTFPAAEIHLASPRLARLANELLIVMNIEQAAVWEDTDDTIIVYCIVGGYRSFWRIITSVLITQIRLRRFNCSSHNSKYPGKSTFFSAAIVFVLVIVWF